MKWLCLSIIRFRRKNITENLIVNLVVYKTAVCVIKVA